MEERKTSPAEGAYKSKRGGKIILSLSPENRSTYRKECAKGEGGGGEHATTKMQTFFRSVHHVRICRPVDGEEGGPVPAQGRGGDQVRDSADQEGLAHVGKTGTSSTTCTVQYTTT